MTLTVPSCWRPMGIPLTVCLWTGEALQTSLPRETKWLSVVRETLPSMNWEWWRYPWAVSVDGNYMYIKEGEGSGIARVIELVSRAQLLMCKCLTTPTNCQWCIEQSTKTLVIECCKPISEFAQIYWFLVLLGRKQGLLGTRVARSSLVFCKHIIDTCSVFMASSIGREVAW